MVTINLEHEKYKFTTDNISDRFNIEETIVFTKGINLYFHCEEDESYLKVGDKEYAFESRGSMMFFLQKLSLNHTIMTSLSNATLATVVNEMLAKNSYSLHLVIDKNTDQILTVISTTAYLVNWKKIIQIVQEVFDESDARTLYLTTHTGLGISIVMNNADILTSPDLDVIRIEPQTFSSISIYRGIAREEVPLKGYSENEILANFKQKLQLMIDVDPGISKNYPLVRD